MTLMFQKNKHAYNMNDLRSSLEMYFAVYIVSDYVIVNMSIKT
jgi:hypothetical protein